MKNIQVAATIEGVSTLKDGGLSVRLHTQELTPQEKTIVLERQGSFGWFLFSEQQQNEEDLDLAEIRKDVGGKSPSQRLRAVLYIAFQQSGTDASFEQYYARKMEEIINLLKGKLDG